ncbi:MAG TPA: serine hydrolase, partial [Chitinophagaceae bacterium]|nr:serine hydrolase [Chitinophagaceae bacterium]
MKIIFPVISAIFIFYSCSSSKKTVGPVSEPSDILSNLLKQYSTVYSEFDSVLQKKDELKVQIIYTQIDRDKKGNPVFRDFYFNNNDSNYFYPASTVKLPIAILALQKLNQVKIEGLDKNTTMITGEDGDGQTAVSIDSTAADKRPTIAHYIKRILLVSDNDAFNRLYEFLGQEYINNSLHAMGYEATQIIHRLDISLTEQQNRHTNPVRFYDNNGKLVYEKPAEKSRLVYATRNTKIGRGHMKGDSIVHEPLDFSKKNRLLLKDLHNIVRSVMFPQSVPTKQRFDLTNDDYNFLRRYMSTTPPESTDPSYDSSYHASYVKFLFYGGEKGKTRPDIRIFNKVGDAYGFLIDASYFADFDHHIEFMLSAVIYCNSDGILNDDT